MLHSRSTRIQDHFGTLTDPRRRKGTDPLINIVTIALCAVIAGADDFVAIAAWGTQKRKWLEGFLDLSDGIPSHDWFNAILGALRPGEFERCLLSWIAEDFARVKVSRHETRERGHGRDEHRSYFVCTAPDNLPDRARWRKLTAIGVASPAGCGNLRFTAAAGWVR